MGKPVRGGAGVATAASATSSARAVGVATLGACWVAEEDGDGVGAEGERKGFGDGGRVAGGAEGVAGGGIVRRGVGLGVVVVALAIVVAAAGGA